jgi:vancomycin resistance protein YoaR
VSDIFGVTESEREDTDTADPSDDRRRDRRLLRWLVLVLLLVAGALYVAGYAVASDRLPRGTEVAGVDVGGRKADAAERALARGLDDRLLDPVELDVEGEQVAIDPVDAGLDVDIPASIAQVPVGRSWNPADMWETLVGGGEYEPVVVTVDDLLEERLEELADDVDEPPVEGGVEFTPSGAKPQYPETGASLDVDQAAAAVVAAYPTDGTPVRLTLDPAPPEISARDVSRAMKRFANPAMSAPVTYRVGGEPVVLRPSRYARALSMRAEEGRLVPAVHGGRLREVFRPAMGTLTTDGPQDASVRIVDGQPQVIPARNGVTIDWDRVERSFLRLVAAEQGDRVLDLPTEVAEPAVTTEEVRQLGIREEVSEFTTYYPHAEYRNINIGRAAALINGTVLEPGSTFSLNETVGQRTAENGFAKGFVISNGVFAEDYGGGVSQVATTTFNAAFFAGLEDVEHKPHSFYIDRYPVGREATVAWPTVDLRFTNDTGHGVLIETVHTPSTVSTQGALTVRMWSTKVWDIESLTSERYAYTAPDTRHMSGDECIPNEGYSGFQVDVTRVFRRAGQSAVVRREVMHTTYTPSDTVVCS